MKQPKFNKGYNPWGITAPFLFGDIDNDRRKDNVDCEPFNHFKQHVSKTMKKRVNALDVTIVKDDKFYYIGTKKAKKVAPKEVKTVYAIAKKHPEVVGELERHKKSWFVVANSSGSGGYGMGTGMVTGYVDVKKLPPEERKLGKQYNEFQTLHELRHTEQSREDKDAIKKYKKFKGEWKDNPYEIDANKYATEKMKEKKIRPSEEEVSEGYRHMIDESEDDGEDNE